MGRLFKVKVVINSEEAKSYAVRQLTDCKVDDNLEFSLDVYKGTRTTAQNSLMWMILTDMQDTSINEFSGSTKEEWHELLKKDYLVTIFERDDPDNYGVMIETLREVYREGLTDMAEVLHKNIVIQTSTKDCNLNQFSEYLKCIMSYCNERGMAYRLPQDLYNKAMGEK